MHCGAIASCHHLNRPHFWCTVVPQRVVTPETDHSADALWCDSDLPSLKQTTLLMHCGGIASCDHWNRPRFWRSKDFAWGQTIQINGSEVRIRRAQELCESRGNHPGLPVPNGLCSLCGRKATLNWTQDTEKKKKKKKKKKKRKGSLFGAFLTVWKSSICICFSPPGSWCMSDGETSRNVEQTIVCIIVSIC